MPSPAHDRRTLMAAALLLGAVVCRGDAPLAQEQGRHEITLTAKRFAFSPPRIEVAANDVVKITLVAEDIPHSFTIDEYRIEKRAAPGRPVTFEFRADKAGTFPFYCSLTIDDGCASVYTRMLPILRRHGAQAILFVTTDAASAVFREAGTGERRLTDPEIRELAAAGVEIGSHAVSHRPLSAMQEEEIRRELADSKRELERVTGAPVRHFAVPANWYDDRVLRIASETGYEAVFCSRPSTVRHGAGAFGIARVNVEGGLDLDAFARALSPAGIAQRRLVMVLRGLPKRLVGPRAWTALRESALGRAGGQWLSPSRMAAAAAVAVGAGLLAVLGWLLARS